MTKELDWRDIIGNAKRRKEWMYGDMMKELNKMGVDMEKLYGSPSGNERRITSGSDPLSLKMTPDKANSYFYGISFAEWEKATGVERDWTKMGVEDLKPFFRILVDDLHRFRAYENERSESDPEFAKKLNSFRKKEQGK